MHARLISVVADTQGSQQKDNLCGPFWAARVLNESGFATWDDQPIDQDLIALRAGTLLPSVASDAGLPPGALSRAAYDHSLRTAPLADAGTAAGRLAEVVEAASAGQLRCLTLKGAWNVERIERLLDEARDLGARLIANLRTGRLWGSRPPIEVLLAELDARPVQDPAADWDVGHFVELEMLIRGPRGSLVVVHDSYPSLGWQGRHLQPPHAVAAALERGDGREGGVLVIVPKVGVNPAKVLAAEIGLDVRFWNNGCGS